MEKVIGFGSALTDLLAFTTDEFLQEKVGGLKGGMELIDEETKEKLVASLSQEPELAPGGSAANTIVGLARLGQPAKMVSKLGRDDFGTAYVDSMSKNSVDVSSYKYSQDMGTGCCLSMITPDSQRTMRTFLGASSILDPAEITEADFAGCSHAHIEGYLLFNHELMMHILKMCKKCDCTVSLDLAAPEVVMACKDMLPDLLDKYVDIVFANEDEAAAFAGTDSEEAALQILSEYCRIAVVKVGKRGSMVMADGEFSKVDACVVEAIDTTGAGDLWAAGFIYGMLNSYSYADAALLGSKVAAEVVQCTGAQIPDQRWDYLKDQLK